MSRGIHIRLLSAPPPTPQSCKDTQGAATWILGCRHGGHTVLGGKLSSHLTPSTTFLCRQKEEIIRKTGGRTFVYKILGFRKCLQQHEGYEPSCGENNTPEPNKQESSSGRTEGAYPPAPLPSVPPTAPASQAGWGPLSGAEVEPGGRWAGGPRRTKPSFWKTGRKDPLCLAHISPLSTLRPFAVTSVFPSSCV